MTIHSLRSHVRPDNLKGEVRVHQSLARRIYLGVFAFGIVWIVMQFVGPMVFMDANGLVLARRDVVSIPYQAQVVTVAVRPGDHVVAGQKIATVISAQMLQLISTLTMQKARYGAERIQIDAKLASIAATLPVANKSARDTAIAAQAVDRARAGGYSTVTRQAEMAQARFAAIQEAAKLRAEEAALKGQDAALNENIARVGDALKIAKKMYHRGTIVAQHDGIVGPTVVSAGTVLTPGNKVAEIYRGKMEVLAYLPTDRFYSLRPGDEVVVTDGLNRQRGLVERIDAIADRIPAEFQPAFASVERQQVVRIVLDDGSDFPLLSKVRVKSVYAPSNLVASAGRMIETAALKVIGMPANSASAGSRFASRSPELSSLVDSRPFADQKARMQRLETTGYGSDQFIRNSPLIGGR